MSAANVTVRPRARDWSRVAVGSPDLAAADRDALGTTARIVTWPAENLPGMLAAVDAELALLDSQASRFREDSELSALHAAGGGTHRISDGLAEAVGIALAAAAWTGGLADPTVGGALIALGYDRDFALIGGAMRDGQALARAGLGGAPHGGGAPHDGGPPGGGACPAVAVPGWRSVRLAGNLLTLPPGVRLDLGATAKGLGADRCARAAHRAARHRGGVLVSLGGDLAVAGQPPAGGWPVLVADEHRQVRAARNLAARMAAGAPDRRAPGSDGRAAGPAATQLVRLARGALATSSVTCRRWERHGRQMHHLIDPRTGWPAAGPWRTVSVAAATCAQANAASTAAIIAGEDAVPWLAARGLPARLVGHDGTVALTPGWPSDEGGPVAIPAGDGPAGILLGVPGGEAGERA